MDTADAASAAPAVNVTRLTHEALSKSGLLWVRVPGGGGTHAVWHVWHDDGDPRGTGPAAYVVSGPGEQSLPWLPDDVELILRSKDTGGRLLTVHATVRELTPEDDGWDAAVELLRPERLNAVGDVARSGGPSRARSTSSPRTGGRSSSPAPTPTTPGPRRSARQRARRPAGGPGTGAAAPGPAATPAPDPGATTTFPPDPGSSPRRGTVVLRVNPHGARAPRSG